MSKKKTNEIKPYLSFSVKVLRLLICIALFISVIALCYIGLTQDFKLTDLKEISNKVTTITFVLISFTFSISFLNQSVQHNITYKENVKKYIFNMLLFVSISILAYVFSFMTNLSQFFINSIAIIDLACLIYSILRTLVFIITNFQIDSIK